MQLPWIVLFDLFCPVCQVRQLIVCGLEITLSALVCQAMTDLGAKFSNNILLRFSSLKVFESNISLW